MSYDLPFDLIELVPCPATSIATPLGSLREVAFRDNAWLPEEIQALRTRFASDEGVQDIAASLDRRLAGVRSKIAELGLRRNSLRPWSDLEDEDLAHTYGAEAASAIAARLGRSTPAVYVRATLLGLTEGNAPPYTDWEIAQIRAGYAQGVPVAQLGALIGRPASGIATVASRLGIGHANSPPGWSECEQRRALELAETGIRYAAIADRLEAEGFPRREGRTVGQTLRRLGYGRGWGRPWIAEEDDLIRRVYAQGGSLTPLQATLGRSRTSITYRAGELGLKGTPARPNGWRTDPPWTEDEIAILRRDYGRVPTPALAAALGRKKGGVFNKAFVLGLKHGYIKPFSEAEKRAIHIAREHGLSLADLSAALDRDCAVISKHAIRMGIPFATRVKRASRGPRQGRVSMTLDAILALGDRPASTPGGHPEETPELAPCATFTPKPPHTILVAMPDVRPMPPRVLRAMHDAGLLRTAAATASIALLTGRPPGWPADRLAADETDPS